MKTNISVVPRLFSKDVKLSLKMARGFARMGRTILMPKKDVGRDHMKDLCLMYIKLTPLCNLRCVMCGQRGDKGTLKGEFAANEAKSIVPLETYKKVIDEVAPKKPIFYLWGGEPFLYPDLFPLVRYIQDKGMFVSVNTNGTLLEKYAEQIVREKWNALFVSLDGFEEVNDTIRGAGSYQKVIKGFEAINREKEKQGSHLPFLGVVTTVTNKNYMYLEELAEASRSFKLDWHIYNLGTYTNDVIVAKQKALMKEKFDTDIDCLEGYNTGYNENIDGHKLYEILEKMHNGDYGHPIITVPALNPEKINEYYADLEKPVRNHCIVPWCQTNINYNGDVHFCADYPDYVLGNIKEQSFSEIYNGERANKFRKEIHNSENGMFPGCLRCYQNMLFGKKIKGY
ncbi:MAG: radical SAM protein [Spirochaetaceae bacterium]|nr:radical SAM protein [Spirochaetaceae bacterium]